VLQHLEQQNHAFDISVENEKKQIFLKRGKSIEQMIAGFVGQLMGMERD